MYKDYTCEEIYKKLTSDSTDQFKVGCWVITTSVHKFCTDELERMVSAFLVSPHLMNITCINWGCSLILHVLPHIKQSQLKASLSNLLVSFLDVQDENVVSYAAETIARANYLLTAAALNRVCGFLQRHANTGYPFGVVQNLVLMGWGIEDFISDEIKPVLEDCCKQYELELAIELKNDLYKVKVQGIVFYISDFLSGKSFLQPPTAEIYTATLLSNEGYLTSIFDNRLYHVSIDTFISMLREARINTVIVNTTPYDQVSIYYVDYRLDRIICDVRALKNAGFTVICTGSHVTVRAEEFLKSTGTKYAIKGEMELSLLNFAKKTCGFLDMDDKVCGAVENLYIYDGTTVTYNGDNECLLRPDISLFPMPDYDFVDMSGYYGDEYVDNNHKIKAAWGSILAQRGCPFKCAYCYHFFGSQIRRRTPKQVVDEMELLEKKYNVQQIFFIDNTFTVDKKWVDEVCNLILERKLTIAWNCETRADCLSKELLHQMKKANCKRIWIGAETFNDSLLHAANKGTTELQTREIARMVMDVGIKLSCFLMIGLPGETKETIKNTLRAIIESDLEYTKSIITFIPRDGTPLFEMVLDVVKNPTFHDMNMFKGLLKNDITELDIIKTIEQMSMRDINQWRLPNGEESA